MPNAIHSPRHKRLTELLIEYRLRAGLTQAQVAKHLGRHQPFVANIESGQRRVDIVELLQLAEIIGFDPHDVIDKLQAV
jgi:transcriptional regulator with XRE-family HTH domain